MKQYYSIKAVHPDAILLFRVGDFYETFGEDAIKASGILGLRSRGGPTVRQPTSNWRGSPTMPSTPTCPSWCGGRARSHLRAAGRPQAGAGAGQARRHRTGHPGIVLGDNILANKENAFLA